MEPTTPKKRQLMLALTLVVFVGLAAVSIALFQRSKKGSLAPTAPSSQPQAAEISSSSCSVAFDIIAPTPTPSNTPSPQTCVSVDKSVEDNNCMQQNVALSLLVNNACGTQVRAPLDVMIVFDNSLSMGDLGGNPEEPISSAKAAAAAFVSQLDSTLDKVGLVSFSTDATLRSQLTSDFSAVQSSIASLQPDDATNVGDGIFVGQAELSSSRARANAQHIIVLLGDGVPNQNHAGSSGCAIWPTNSNACTQDAINQANAAKTATPPTTIYAIGYRLDSYTQNYTPQVGALAKQTLRSVASSPNTYFESPSINDINGVFSQIATIISSPIVATQAVITEVLPAGVSYVPGSAIPEPQSISADGKTLTWNIGTLNTLQIPITFDVQFSSPGNQLVELYPDSVLTFIPPNSTQTVTLPFPERFANPQLDACLTPTATTTPTSTPIPTSTPTSTPLPTATLNPSSTPVPTDTPIATSTPIGATCNTISMHTFGANQTPTVGEQVTFTCGDVAGAFRYEFRIKGLTPDNAIFAQIIAPIAADSNVSQAYTIDQPATYTAECRVCTGTDANTCQPWETGN